MIFVCAMTMAQTNAYPLLPRRTDCLCPGN